MIEELTFRNEISIKNDLIAKIKEFNAPKYFFWTRKVNDDNLHQPVGCLICHAFGDKPYKNAELCGLPEWFIRVCDEIHRYLPVKDLKNDFINLIESIPVGKNINSIKHELMIWILGNDSPSAFGNKQKLVTNLIDEIKNLHVRASVGLNVDSTEWESVRDRAFTIANTFRSTKNWALDLEKATSWAALRCAAFSCRESDLRAVVELATIPASLVAKLSARESAINEGKSTKSATGKATKAYLKNQALSSALISEKLSEILRV